MSYLDLGDYKEWANVTRATDVPDDDEIQVAIDAAEAGINEGLQRQITVAGSATPRLFAPNGSNILRIHDCTTVTIVSDNGSVLSAADYQLEPVNGLGWSGQARPYEQIRRVSGAPFYSVFGKASVTVTATWGWAAIPPQVLTAARMLTKDILANRSVSFGIAGFTEYAGIRARANPQVWDQIRTLRRVESFGIA